MDQIYRDQRKNYAKLKTLKKQLLEGWHELNTKHSNQTAFSKHDASHANRAQLEWLQQIKQVNNKIIQDINDMVSEQNDIHSRYIET